MIAARPDLLVIGGLTVDRFADGSSAPGGSVLHIVRAAAARGLRIAVITSAGPEPDAQAGIRVLRRLAMALEVAPADATATFGHRNTPHGRQLRLERRGGPVTVAGSPMLAHTPAVLLAPVASEVSAEDLSNVASIPVRAAILQGWLRGPTEGADVRPLRLDDLGARLREALARFDLLVASREDLLAESDDPQAQLAALRRALGGRPTLVVTDGTEGAWLDTVASGTRHLPVPRRVKATSTVGAGDILAAFLVIGAGDRSAGPEQRAVAAMRVVAEVLEERRR